MSQCKERVWVVGLTSVRLERTSIRKLYDIIIKNIKMYVFKNIHNPDYHPPPSWWHPFWWLKKPLLTIQDTH